MKRKWLIATIAGSVGVVAVMATTLLPARIAAWNETSRLTHTHITYVRRACTAAPCPVYQVDIFGDGRVIYQGMANVRTRGAWTYRIPQKELLAWLSDFRTSGYWNHPRSETPGDGSTCRVTMTTKRSKQSNGCYDLVGNDKMTLEAPRIAPDITQMEAVLQLDTLVSGTKPVADKRYITQTLKPYDIKHSPGK